MKKHHTMKAPETTRKLQMYWNVPTWAPTKGKYCKLTTPVCRWLEELIAEQQQLLLHHDISIHKSLKADEDLQNLCHSVNKLRIVNWNLCDQKIYVTSEKIYSHSAWNEELQTRFNKFDEKTGIVTREPGGRVAVWKRDMKLSKNRTLIDALSKRLSSFHEKRGKIDFNSPPMIEYNISISSTRIELDSICCAFLNSFLPNAS